jgi:carbon storage regulator
LKSVLPLTAACNLARCLMRDAHEAEGRPAASPGEYSHGGFMLVLSRKLGQRILVPHCELAVTIVAIDGKNVRLGISAPDDVTVYREEVWLQIAGECKKALPARK